MALHPLCLAFWKRSNWNRHDIIPLLNFPNLTRLKLNIASGQAQYNVLYLTDVIMLLNNLREVKIYFKSTRMDDNRRLTLADEENYKYSGNPHRVKTLHL